MSRRTSALCLPVEGESRVEALAYARRTPIFTVTAGRVLISLTLPERLLPAHVRFARRLAEQAAAYATEVERMYRNGNAKGAA